MIDCSCLECEPVALAAPTLDARLLQLFDAAAEVNSDLSVHERYAAGAVASLRRWASVRGLPISTDWFAAGTADAFMATWVALSSTWRITVYSVSVV